MITETTINIYPLVPIIKLVIIAITIGIVAFLFHNGFGVNIFVKKDMKAKELDTSIMGKLIDKYPDVVPEFMKKGLREQNIENNQEIHAINQRFDKFETEMAELKEITSKLAAILEELEKRG